MYFKTILTTTFFALLTGTAMAQDLDETQLHITKHLISGTFFPGGFEPRHAHKFETIQLHCINFQLIHKTYLLYSFLQWYDRRATG
ncbi:uncharacterized protein N7477_009376 [Penicillium maclennaniae]|uniref:uncharacterized protein n=1 Tax=Penicillium maclennaniae TaxID=1343394 RepID=UPI002541FEEF|nr:uncharacterized protein N7477_009376 [Penicillium maclennaniae]KAJ5661760.1 hypothetical protein N7477_009376 [Penicillium maclennaniae]